MDEEMPTIREVIPPFELEIGVGFGFRAQGMREYQQDGAVITTRTRSDGEREALVVLADGHGPYGGLAATTALQLVVDAFRCHQLPSGDGFPVAIRALFLEIDRILNLQWLRGGFTNEELGTCLTVAVASPSTGIQTAYVGNAEGFISLTGEMDAHPFGLAHEIHRNSAERDRVAQLGAGCIPQQEYVKAKLPKPIPAFPVVSMYIFPACRADAHGIEMTRALGHGLMHPVISPEPDIAQFPWPVTGGVVVIGSDGIWGSLNKREEESFLKELTKGDVVSTLELFQWEFDRYFGDNATVAVLPFL